MCSTQKKNQYQEIVLLRKKLFPFDYGFLNYVWFRSSSTSIFPLLSTYTQSSTLRQIIEMRNHNKEIEPYQRIDK